MVIIKSICSPLVALPHTQPRMHSHAGAWERGNLSKYLRVVYFLLAAYSLLLVSPVFAKGPLIEPLTLDYALLSADGNHPDLQIARADISASQAQVDLVESNYGVESYIQGRLRWIDPVAIDPDQSTQDHKIGLIVSKNLYDFGRTNAAESAAVLSLRSSEDLYVDKLNQHQLQIMTAYFNVLLADLQFIRDNEAMSVAYIIMDRAQMKNELGQVSDVDVLKAQSNYQSVRKEYYASRSLQRSTRAMLANLINRPGQLSKDLAEPELDSIQRKIPDFEELEFQALQQNPLLLALRTQIQAAEKRVESARAGARPLLNGEVELADYSRETRSSNNAWKVGVTIDIPLLTGGSVQAAVAKEQAELLRAKATLRKEKMRVSQTLLEFWQLLDTLRIEREETSALLEYKDLALDESRALYEMEVKADLGDSMVQVSNARLKNAEARYSTALLWAKIDALQGKSIRGKH